MTDQHDAVAAAIADFPGSLRTLAACAGVSPALLSMISTGGKRQATDAVATKVADALERKAQEWEQWAQICSTHAARIRGTE